MINGKEPHTFHIPVMGIGYSIDSPVRVAKYGISSVISMVDDGIIEKMRQYYSFKLNIPFQPIPTNSEDYRARRITAYLNLIDELVKQSFEELKDSFDNKSKELQKYFEMLPDSDWLKEKYESVVQKLQGIDLKKWLNANLISGAIDVNIMTKLDKANTYQNNPLPVEYNDAHAAMRGFAISNLSNSSLVLSAGLNPRLYSYIEKFEDFYPKDDSGFLKKKITLKVSDFRSALIQGKFLAKKGIWVSEYRIESGLNCGGHAFVSQGSLIGPVLDEFRLKRDSLVSEVHAVLVQALKDKNRFVPQNPLQIKVTAQGGVGTSIEHNFLLKYYNLDSVGWGTPFLLVPEVTNVDDETLKLLQDAREEDVYLSDISPYGVPFNNIRNNTKDIQKEKRIADGKPGSNCIKKYGSFNFEFPGNPVCTGSREYQKKKLAELSEKTIDKATYDKEYRKIVDKACICVGLGTAALMKNGISIAAEGEGVSVCPGPNIAYFSKIVSLQEMVDHIYGRTNIIERTDRPHVFINELVININYLETKIADNTIPTDKSNELIAGFKSYFLDGIKYYENLFQTVTVDSEAVTKNSLKQLEELKLRLNKL
ncbi:MAG: hypothetical protein HY951_10925 [Bacteroidia bacterium]|nr:hypothetical protein [Bacteroidia bacterium]